MTSTSRDTTLPDSGPQQQQTPKTNQIRSFIRNIGLPSSPIMGKKSSPGSQVAKKNSREESQPSGVSSID